MLIDLGLGVRHRNYRLNCRVLCTYRKLFLILPKMNLANDGLYREARHFTAWPKRMEVEDYYLEEVVRNATGQRTVKIGDAVLSTLDTCVGCETCESLFVPLNPSTYSTCGTCRICSFLVPHSDILLPYSGLRFPSLSFLSPCIVTLMLCFSGCSAYFIPPLLHILPA